MVLFILYMKAEADGVKSVEIKKNADLCISVRNPLSDYEVRENVIVDTSELLEPETDHESEAHFRIRWEGNPKSSHLKVLTATEAKMALKKSKHKKIDGFLPRSFTDDDSGDFVPLLMVECRGLEPYGFTAGTSEWKITSEGGMVFDEDIDVSEGDWADYDAEADAPVSLSEVEFKWEGI